MLDFILNHERNGLKNIADYDLELLDVFLSNYGLPHQQWWVHIILVKTESRFAVPTETASR